MRKAYPKPLLFAALSSTLVFLLGSSVLAVTLAQNFQSSEALARGTVVSLSSQDGNVDKASRDNLGNLFGIVVESGDISFGQNGQTSVVSVASSGVVDALVSDINGSIKTGDAVTVDGV